MFVRERPQRMLSIDQLGACEHHKRRLHLARLQVDRDHRCEPLLHVRLHHPPDPLNIRRRHDRLLLHEEFDERLIRIQDHLHPGSTEPLANLL